MRIGKRAAPWLTAVIAGFVATHLVNLLWRLVVGERPPKDPDDPAESTLKVVLSTGLVAAAAAIAQVVARRRVAARYQVADEVNTEDLLAQLAQPS
jgi:hypothetical protein